MSNLDKKDDEIKGNSSIDNEIENSNNTVDEEVESALLRDLANSDKEKPVNLAGPSLASVALAHMRRITGDTKRNFELKKGNPLKVKYLKEGIKEQILELEKEFEKERLEREGIIDKNLDKTDSNSQSEIPDSMFFEKAKRRISHLKAEKNENLSKIKSNFRLFIIIICGLALYYGYYQFTRNSDEPSLISMAEQLPLKLDANGQTILQKIETVDNNVIVTILRAEDSINETDEFKEALDSFVKNVSLKFCKIDQMVKVTKAGKTIKVNIDASNGSYHREFICEGQEVKDNQ